MDTVAAKEQIEIIRRAAERGLGCAHDRLPFDPANSQMVDVFQHILDEVAVLKVFLDV